MQRSLWINGALVALALASFGLVWATRERPTTSELVARKNQLFPEFEPSKLQAVTFTKAGQTLELRRQGGQFEIVAPWRERADVATMNKWLSAVDMATVERPADGVSAEQGGFGPSAYRATIELGRRALKLTLGGPAPTPTGARYARVETDGRELTWVVRGSVAAELELGFDSFRETRMLEYGRRELHRIRLQSPRGVIELEQRAHGAFFVRVGAGWELARPDAVRAIVEHLSRLSSEVFVEPELARSALGDAAVRLTLEPKEAAAGPVSITLGGKCPRDEQLALLLREQAGRGARAGCVDASLVSSLTLDNDTLRLRGPFAAEADEVEELYIARGARKLELARKDKAFVLRAPSNTEVALNAGNQRISAVLGAHGELAPPDAVGEGEGELRVQITGSDEASHREERVLLGRRRADMSVCFKRLADNVTRCVKDRLQASYLEPDASSLRGSSLLAFAPSELASFSVQTRELRQRVVRGRDGSYELEEPPGYAHDAARVVDIVQSLGTLEAERWLAPGEQAAFGLETPALRVTIHLVSSPEPRELVVGDRHGGSRYARLSPDPSVFLLSESLYEALSEPLIDRTLSPLHEAELDRIELHRRGQKAAAAEGQLRESLLALRATGVLHLGRARAGEGFEAPELTLAYVGRGGEKLRVAIGVCEPSPALRCYARREDVDATFTLHGDIARTLRDLIRR